MAAKRGESIWAAFDKEARTITLELQDDKGFTKRVWCGLSCRETIDKLKFFCGLKKDEARTFVEEVQRLEDPFEYLVMEV